MIDLRLQTEYWFTESVGIGAGYTLFDIDFEWDLGRGYEFTANYRYQGPEAYLTVRF